MVYLSLSWVETSSIKQVSQIASYVVTFGAVVFNVSFFLAIRSSWALFEIREELLKSEPNRRFIDDITSNEAG